MDIMAFLPELVLVLMTVIFFGLSLFNASPRIVGLVAFFGGIVLVLAGVAGLNAEGEFFFKAYRVDLFSQTFKLILVLGFAGILAMDPRFPGLRTDLSAEYGMFLTLATAGLVFLVSATELITLVICLEISSFSLYVAVPMRRDMHRVQFEAGIKYILFGAFATGVMVFGMSYVVGFAGTSYFADLGKVLPGLFQSQPLALIGFLLFLMGLFYKLALFPMHFWAPDIYEGSANETTAFIAILPKIAAVALLIHILAICGMNSDVLVWIFMIFAVLSMTYGNLAALVQNDVKRLLAYSAIAHAGYVMVGLLSVGSEGFVSAAYYIFGYCLMSLGCFFVICKLSNSGENIYFGDLRGLHKRSPILALILTISACGMAGIPPTVGFLAKFMVFASAIGKGYYVLVCLAVVNAGISAFYYLRLIRAAYTLQEGSDFSDEKVPLGIPSAVFGLFLAIMILLVGIIPEPIVHMAEAAIAALL